MREGWKEVELGYVCNYVKDKTSFLNVNERNYISADNMVSNFGGITNSEYVPSKGTVSSFKSKDILVSNIRPYFKKIWYASFDGGCSNDVFILRTDEKNAYSKFLFYLISQQEFFDYMMAGANGTKMPRGNKNSIIKFKFLLPPLETQRKIAKILSNYDDLIENNLKRIKILEEMAQQTYEEWFVRMRFPGHESATINPETGLPEGWEKVKLGEVCNFSQGLQVPIEKQFTQFSNELIRFIRIVDVTQNTNDIRYIESPKSLNQFVHFKDVFMVRYGAPQVVTNYHGIIANNFFRININDENKLKRKFLFSFLNRNEIKENLLAMSVSATMPAISFKSFSTLDIILPEIEVQAKFHKYVDTTYDLILNLQNQNQRLREARDILLPRLMMGMVEV